MIAVCSAETSVTNHRPAHHHTPEHRQQCENIKSHKVWTVSSRLAHCN